MQAGEKPSRNRAAPESLASRSSPRRLPRIGTSRRTSEAESAAKRRGPQTARPAGGAREPGRGGQPGAMTVPGSRWNSGGGGGRGEAGRTFTARHGTRAARSLTQSRARGRRPLPAGVRARARAPSSVTWGGKTGGVSGGGNERVLARTPDRRVAGGPDSRESGSRGRGAPCGGVRSSAGDPPFPRTHVPALRAGAAAPPSRQTRFGPPSRST